MKTTSLWENTKTFFPLVMDRVQSIAGDKWRSACVVGASDGKFVLPLAAAGLRVLAIEVDAKAIYGGEVNLPGGKLAQSEGLVARLEAEGLASRVRILHADFLKLHDLGAHDLVFTSCSWQYSLNKAQPPSVFIRRMQKLVAPRGVFAAEYMMPCEPRHMNMPHYLNEGELRSLFGAEWEVIDNFYTDAFPEAAHVGNLTDHEHRMGFFLAKKM